MVVVLWTSLLWSGCGSSSGGTLCDGLFGSQPGYVSCGSTPAGGNKIWCTFYTSSLPQEESCDTVCQRSVGSCAGAAEERMDGSCSTDPSMPLACNSVSHDRVCTCEITPP
jgi:hypothetical protein